MELKVTEAAKSVLARKGWDPQFGARPLRRAIQRMVEDELAEEMLKGTFRSGDHILGDVDPDNPERLKYSKIPSVEPPAAPPTSEPAVNPSRAGPSGAKRRILHAGMPRRRVTYARAASGDCRRASHAGRPPPRRAER